MKTDITIKYATFGSISSATLRPRDLLSAFIHELEWQIQRNGKYFSMPEHCAERDRLNGLMGEAADCFDAYGEDIAKDKEELASDLINESFPNAFQSFFCAPYVYFGAHIGDGADFGYWPEIESARETCDFVSSVTQEYPDDDFTGEWLHINERGNCTLYVRENGKDRELWSVV